MRKLVVIASSLLILIGLSGIAYQYLSKKVALPQVTEPTATQEQAEAEPLAETPINFDLLRFSGGSKEVAEFQGKPVVLNFWASTCPPCLYEMPFFEENYQKYGEDVTFLMVNVLDFRGETAQTAKAFMKEQEYTMPAYFEIDQAGSFLFNVTSVPRTYFLDEAGLVTDSHLGAIEAGDLSNQIEKLLAK